MSQTCGLASFFFHIFHAKNPLYRPEFINQTLILSDEMRKIAKQNKNMNWLEQEIEIEKKCRRIKKKPKPWHICLRDKWCRRCGRQTKYRRNLHKSTFQKYFRLYIFLYFSNCKRVKKSPHCICVLHATQNEWNGKDKEDLKEGFAMFARITYCSRSTVGFSYRRYGHIHKLIKMFNQSYTRKKFVFFSWVECSVFFCSPVFFGVQVDKALSSLF